MKRLLVVLLALLAAAATIAPAHEKAEKLRIDKNDWASQWSYDSTTQQFSLSVNMSAQFGIATAAEHNGKFKAALVLTGSVWHDGEGPKDWSGTTGEVDIVKMSGAVRDASGFLALDPGQFEWNGDDDGNGIVDEFEITGVSLSLISPGGNVMSSTTEDLGDGIRVTACGEACPGAPNP